MPLPIISSPTPTVVPAAAAVTYAQSYLTGIQFNAAPGRPWQCVIKINNYDSATDTLAPVAAGSSYQFRSNDIRVEASQYPVLAQTLANVLTTAGLLQHLEHAQSQLILANKLPDTDESKSAKIQEAQALVVSAKHALGQN